MRRTRMIALAAGALVASTARAEPAAPAPPPPAAVAAPAPAPADAEAADDRPRGLALGAEVGQPIAATVAWVGLDGLLGVGAAVGTGTWGGTGLMVRGEILVMPVALRLGAARVVPHLGLGLRYRRHYQPASIDELPDAHTGARAALGVGVRPGDLPLLIYAEAAPGYDLRRTDSCGFASGVDSLCPHSQSSRGFFEATLGARWYLALP